MQFPEGLWYLLGDAMGFFYFIGVIKLSSSPSSWFVYILRCRDNSLYTGITTNLHQRLQEHNFSLKGAKYTRGRRPVSMVYAKQHPSRSAASSREYEIKQLTKTDKELLIENSDFPDI